MTRGQMAAALLEPLLSTIEARLERSPHLHELDILMDAGFKLVDILLPDEDNKEV